MNLQNQDLICFVRQLFVSRNFLETLKYKALTALSASAIRQLQPKL